MSGPTTVIIAANPVATLLAASGIRAAMAVHEGYAQAAVLQREHQQAHDSLRASQNAAIHTGQHAMDESARAAESAFDQLIILADRLGMAGQVRATRPAAPEAGKPEELAAWIRALQMLADELRAILLTEAARQTTDCAGLPVDIALPAAATASEAQSLLARVAHLGALPEHIQGIALELENTLPGTRADLLLTELRMRIQTHIQAVQAQQLQQATATIVDQSLKDLGYQVEEISSTLFVEGGVVHFRKQGWGNYMVRMRVNAKAATANFNVIRAVTEGNNERSVLDHLAEDRWCSEFPALMQALEVRGIHLNVTRRLAAGELPVQLVDAARLPGFAEEESAAASTQALAQPLTREHK